MIEAGLQRHPESAVVVFLHIPKTAGISFRRMLKQRLLLWPPWKYFESREALRYIRVGGFAERLAGLESTAPEGRRAVKYWEGHFGYGIHELFAGPVSYLTLVRDPVERALSTYRHLQRPEVARRHGVPRGIDLAGFIDLRRNWGGLHGHYFDNCQVRYLGGERGRPIDVPFGECTDGMLQTALERLESMPFVGIVEQFDESVAVLQEFLGVRFPYYRRSNVSPDPRGEVPDDAEALAGAHNRLDRVLYDAATRRFDETLRRFGSRVEQSARGIRSRSRIAARLRLP